MPNDVCPRLVGGIGIRLTRDRNRDRSIIWLDQISINQSKILQADGTSKSSPEKGQQVKKMGEVYEFAGEVVSIISSPDSKSDRLLEPLDCPPANVEQNIERAVKKHYTKMYDARALFSKNSYWNRVWILQELTMAQRLKLICGAHEVNFEHVSRLVMRLQERDSFTSLIYGSFKDVWNHRGRQSAQATNIADHVAAELEIFFPDRQARYRDKPFIDVLNKARRFNGCYNPNDLVFARLALASDARLLSSRADVNYDMPVRALFKQFAKNYIVTYEDLRIITFSTWWPATSALKETPMRKEHNLHTLPSWIPDWSSPAGCWDAASGTDQEGCDNQLSYIAWSSNTGPRVNPNNDDELIATGRQLAVVTRENMNSTMEGQSIIEGKIRQRHPELYNETPHQDSDMPMPGDIICALRGAPAFVCLREYGSYFAIVGRQRRRQRETIVLLLCDVVETAMTLAGTHVVETAEYGWRFKSVEMIQSLPEIVYNIR